MVSVLIMAAGNGVRAGLNTPKQYAIINGKSILEHTIEKFLSIQNINIIQVVIAKGHESYISSSFRRKPESSADLELLDTGLRRYDGVVIHFTFGGSNRQESVRLGLEALKNKVLSAAPVLPNAVLIHDAARPFVSEKTIEKIINELKNYDAVIPAQRIADTVKQIDGNLIQKTIDRSNLVSVQTPQGFKFDKIYELHQKYKNENLTDDASLFELENLPVNYIISEEDNFKITTQSDFEKAEIKMQKNKHYRVGSGFDVHQFEEGDGVILCGIKVPYYKKLKGHSDADVAWHALTDAILGAIGKGDIGELFSDADERWKNANSIIFLQKANQLLTEMGGEIINIDITIIAEAPKLSNFKNEMAINTATALNIDISKVNIKATTTEKLGFTGRGEGIAAQAVVCVLL